MSEKAGGEDRQSDERRVLLVESESVRRERELCNVEFLETELAEEAGGGGGERS